MPNSLRDELRSAFFADSEAEKEIITFRGKSFEVRQPSVGKRNRIYKAAQKVVAVPKKKGNKVRRSDEDEEFTVEVDSGELQLTAVLECTYVPGTDELVFEPSDRDALLNKKVGGLYDLLAKSAQRLLNFDPEETANFSEATPSGASSSS